MIRLTLIGEEGRASPLQTGLQLTQLSLHLAELIRRQRHLRQQAHPMLMNLPSRSNVAQSGPRIRGHRPIQVPTRRGELATGSGGRPGCSGTVAPATSSAARSTR
jgi:hypothetical protein